MSRWHRLVLPRSLALVAGLVAFASTRTGVGVEAGAQPAPPSSAASADGVPREAVVARVGDKTITLGELEARLAQTPPFMLKKYGSTSAEIKHRFLDEVMVRELLLNQGALDAGVDKRPDVDDRLKSILRSAIIEVAKKESNASTISDADVKEFYDANADKFVAPKRISIWRISVASEAEAREIIGEMKSVDGKTGEDVKKWNQLARDKSLDKATAMRSGNLGFVTADGSTNQPEVKYDAALFAAADNVKDGDVVSEPVREGDKWSVVWRRQGMRPVSRSIESEAATIRGAIADQRVRKYMDDLLTGLRSTQLAEIHPELCEMVTVTDTGDVEKAKRPGVLPKAKRNAQPAPNEGPAGLR